MKRLPPSIKPDIPTYFIAKRMENVGMLRPGQALMLAATAGLAAKKPQNRGKSVPAKKGKRR